GIRRAVAMTRRLALATALTVLPVACGLAEELCQPAPSLQVTNWLRGEPVDLKHAYTNRVHVILFWESSCPSCMASLPQLVELQENLRREGVEIVGVTPEPPEPVKAFLANSEVGPKINFAIACDAERKTMESYMKIPGQSRLPWAFVVDQRGDLVW